MEGMSSIIGKIASTVAAKALETGQKNANVKIEEEVQNKKIKAAAEDALAEIEIENLDLNDDVETAENKGSSKQIVSQSIYENVYAAEMSKLKEQLKQYPENSSEYANIMEKITTLYDASQENFEIMYKYSNDIDDTMYFN